MIAINNESGFWPSQAQKLILRAALLTGPEAIEAWEEWLKIIDINVLDFGSHRMIPQLYRNLLAHGVRHPLMERFKGVYRYYLYKNETLLNRTANVLSEFRDAGIDAILLKGCALVPLYYKESALRPMQDADVLVHVEQAPKAMALLERQGYKPLFLSAAKPQKWIAIRHSFPFADREGRQIDLHWHLLWECWHARDTEYWDCVRPITLRGVSALTVSPTYQLLHTCWHGVRWNEVPPIRWLADAMAILNGSETEINWDLIVEQAQRHRISLPLTDSLLYLKSLLRAPVPENVIKALAGLRTTRMDQIGYEAAADPLAPRKTRRILALLLYDYLWLTKSTSARPAILGYAKFLQAKWNVVHLWQVPFYLFFRSLLRVFKSSSRQNGAYGQSAVGTFERGND